MLLCAEATSHVCIFPFIIFGPTKKQLDRKQTFETVAKRTHPGDLVHEDEVFSGEAKLGERLSLLRLHSVGLDHALLADGWGV